MELHKKPKPTITNSIEKRTSAGINLRKTAENLISIHKFKVFSATNSQNQNHILQRIFTATREKYFSLTRE